MIVDCCMKLLIQMRLALAAFPPQREIRHMLTCCIRAISIVFVIRSALQPSRRLSFEFRTKPSLTRPRCFPPSISAALDRSSTGHDFSNVEQLFSPSGDHAAWMRPHVRAGKISGSSARGHVRCRRSDEGETESSSASALSTRIEYENESCFSF